MDSFCNSSDNIESKICFLVIDPDVLFNSHVISILENSIKCVEDKLGLEIKSFFKKRNVKDLQF